MDEETKTTKPVEIPEDLLRQKNVAYHVGPVVLPADQPLRDHETDEHRQEREQYLRRWVAELGEG